MKHKPGSIFEAAAHILNEIKSPKVGAMVPLSTIPKDDFVYVLADSLKKADSEFNDYLDPQQGGGSIEPNIIAIQQMTKFDKANKDIGVYEVGAFLLSAFVPKSKELQRISKAITKINTDAPNKFMLPPEEKRKKWALQDEAQSLATHFGVVRTTERYKIIVDEAVYKALPDGVIGSTEYDYSFHGGEGKINSWLMAYGKSKGEVLSKLKAGLTKAKFQYVGNEMELKYAQKSAIGRSD